MTSDERSLYDEWRRLVNMSASELERFMRSAEAEKASLTRQQASRQGIRSGRDSGRAIVRMKRKGVQSWNDNDWEWAQRQVNFVKRMRGNKGALRDAKGQRTPKTLSLMWWGHDPEKYRSNGGYRSNPKYRLDLNSPDAFRKLISGRYPDMLDQFEADGIPLGGNVYEREASFFDRPVLMYLRPKSRTIWLLTDRLENLTAAHLLDQIARQLPELRDWHLYYMQSIYGDGTWSGRPLNIRLGEYVDQLRPYRGTLPERQSWRGDDPWSPREYEYLYYRQPHGVLWYHATLNENVLSILRRGLVPSSLGEGRGEGWSPGWNMELQDAVYLTQSLLQASDIGETMAARTGKNPAVVAVQGAALKDLSRVVIDEDAARDEYDGTPNVNAIDSDFPEWETSWHQYKLASLGYRGVIPPRFIELALVGNLVVTEYEGPYGTEQDVELEWLGPMLDQWEREQDQYEAPRLW